MSECMTFPDTVEEFMEQYKVVDTEQVYTNGTEFVPIYRMRQWFQHETERCEDCENFSKTRLLIPQPERKKGKWIDAVLPNDSGGLQVQVCNQCNTFFPLAYTGGGHNFCPNCGADMRGDEHDL